ncbi:protein DROOPING LEAF-like [Curcuma longa]|uniref:protein DROOPING LEAF-like n=1 Tax=Curcuma longa TaxID=136217 RepID=UPI003D9E391C
MDLVSPAEHLCYMRCTYCNTVLAVGVPCKRMMDTMTVKCGHCNHLSFLSPRPIQQHLSLTEHPMSQLQGPCSDCLRVSSLSWFSGEPTIHKPPFVVKPPEKKHRMPSAYNRFMKEEILRIKAVRPDIPHREAFSMAAKNWAKCDPRCSTMASTSESKKLATINISELERNSNNYTRTTESSKVHNHIEKKD